MTTQGTISDQICGFWDMLPTLAEFAGAAPPTDIDGVSIVPTLLGRGRQRQHKAIYWEYPRREGGIARAARMGRWKAVQHDPAVVAELYDLQADIGETRDLAGEQAAIVREIVSFMETAHTEPRDYPKLIDRPTVDDYVR